MMRIIGVVGFLLIDLVGVGIYVPCRLRLDAMLGLVVFASDSVFYRFVGFIAIFLTDENVDPLQAMRYVIKCPTHLT